MARQPRSPTAFQDAAAASGVQWHGRSVPVSSARLQVAEPAVAVYRDGRTATGLTGLAGSLAAGGASAIVIDMTDMQRLAVGFFGVAEGIQKGRSVISQAINHGLRKLKVEVKGDLKKWSGIRMPSKIDAALSLQFSSAATLTGVLRVQSGHTAVTKAYYGAAWGGPSTAGGTHAAWARGQTAQSSFMIRGKKPLFHRTTSSRFPIKTVWGPNFAREVERHQAVVQAKVDIVGAMVAREAARLMTVAIGRAGGR